MHPKQNQQYNMFDFHKIENWIHLLNSMIIKIEYECKVRILPLSDMEKNYLLGPHYQEAGLRPNCLFKINYMFQND
jgi:hypothetical protein